jgi:hypothetical protein
MPAATPVPRGPSVLTLYTAADLLTGPGCPVCRYSGESAGRYLEWFALEGHADVVTITRLCSSLGMCPGCGHDDGTARRALDTLLEGLAAGSARDRYRELGGLCVPHLRAGPAPCAGWRPGWLGVLRMPAARHVTLGRSGCGDQLPGMP